VLPRVKVKIVVVRIRVVVELELVDIIVKPELFGVIILELVELVVCARVGWKRCCTRTRLTHSNQSARRMMTKIPQNQ